MVRVNHLKRRANYFFLVAKETHVEIMKNTEKHKAVNKNLSKPTTQIAMNFLEYTYS